MHGVAESSACRARLSCADSPCPQCPQPWLKVHDVTLQVLVHKATADCYAASVDNRIAIKIGPGDWSPESAGVQIGQREWVLNCSGHQFAIWDAIR